MLRVTAFGRGLCYVLRLWAVSVLRVTAFGGSCVTQCYVLQLFGSVTLDGVDTWLDVLKPALVAYTDALGAGNTVRTNRSEVLLGGVRPPLLLLKVVKGFDLILQIAPDPVLQFMTSTRPRTPKLPGSSPMPSSI